MNLKGFEGSGRGLIEVQPHNSHGETEGNLETPRWSYPGSRPWSKRAYECTALPLRNSLRFSFKIINMDYKWEFSTETLEREIPVERIRPNFLIYTFECNISAAYLLMLSVKNVLRMYRFCIGLRQNVSGVTPKIRDTVVLVIVHLSTPFHL
jgi:hypothetical protein